MSYLKVSMDRCKSTMDSSSKKLIYPNILTRASALIVVFMALYENYRLSTFEEWHGIIQYFIS